MKKNYTNFFRVLLSGMFLSLAFGSLSAQLPFTRSYFNSAYSTIVGGPGTVTTPTTGDDVLGTGFPIGFTFNYLGVNYTSVDANTNGAMAFSGTGLTNSAANTNLYNTTAPNGVITAWWDDMRVDAGEGIYYQTAGTPGSQVFTMEWNCKSYYTGSTTVIRYQVKLYEGTNVIEFHYGPVTNGTVSVSESASIGIESLTGGLGNFLDVVTGSSNTGNYFMNVTTGWPVRNYRLTPGAPAPLAAGTYTAGSTGMYPNLTEAVADINHRGISGPITLSLTDASYGNDAIGGENWFPIVFGSVAGSSPVNTITMVPASGTSTLRYDGAGAGGVGNPSTTIAASTTSEPILMLCGTDYVSVSNLILSATPGTAIIDRGILVTNNGAVDGAQNNTFNNITVALNRNTTSSIGIQQNTVTAATSAAGANSNNTYTNLNIQSVFAGMYLLGSAAFPDLNCRIGTLSPTVFNTIGGTTSNDIGLSTSTVQTYGIRISSQADAKISNNMIQNVGNSGLVDGILCELGQGTNEIFMNKIAGVRNNSATSLSNATGIRANLATTGTHSLRVYNNFVANISSGYTGAASATRVVKGIFLQSAGSGVSTETINVTANNVRIDGTLFPNASNACLEIGTSSGPVINVRNNVLANYTGAQTGAATHNAWFSTSATAIGNTGSISNYNDLYVSDPTNGFTGTGNATTYATLLDWQTAMVGQDANSVVTDPTFISATDLHVTGSGLNNVGNLSATPWVTVDIDNAARSLTTPDIGADEFAPSTIDMQATALTSPLTSGCYSSAQPVSVTVKNNSPVAIDFSVNPTTVTVNITGAITTTLTVTLTSGVLAPGATQVVAMGNANMSTLGTYTFNGFTSVTGDGVPVNDAFTAVNISISAGTASASANTICVGNSLVLSLAGHNGTIQWQGSTDGGTTWINETGTGNTATPYTASPTDTTLYRALVCGTFPSTTVNVNANPVITPTATNDTVCGQGVVNLTAAGSPNINWYTVPTGGVPVATGATYSPFVNTTTTFYAEAVSGGTITSVGLPDISLGGAQQSSTNYQIFDVISNCTLQGVYVYPGAAGTAILEWLTSTGTVLQTSTLTVGPGDVGNRTYFPLGWNLTPGTNYRLGQNTSGVSMFRVSSGAITYPYTIPNVISITGSAAGATFWYYGFDWQILTGCPGPRVPAVATVVAAPSIAITASAATSCGGDPVDLIVSSSNAGYNYVWTPGTGLNTTTNDSVIATPSASTTYIVNGSDTTSGCASADTVTVFFALKPAVTATASAGIVCDGDSVSLSSVAADITAQIGNGTTANTSTGYPSPFGNFYWGSRHQMLILASELQAQGLSAGNLTSLAFDVTNLNAAVPHQNFEIKLALTNATAITAFITPTQTSVYTNPSILPAVGIVPMVFSTPFYWDGISNLLVETCHNNASYTDNVSVNQTPTAFTSTVYYRADAAGVCGNATVTASIAQRPNMYFTGSKTYGYAWTPSTGLTAPTAANTMAAPTALTDYIAMYTDSSTGCVGVDTVTVNVSALPVVNLGPDGNICGTSTTLDAGNAGAMYMWNTTDSTQTILVSTGGTYDVMVTDTIGCSNSDTITIAFVAPPVVNISGNQPVCVGDVVTLDAGIANATYLWNTSATSQTIAVTTPGTYGVDVIDGNGCTGSDSVAVVFNALPNVSLALTVDSLCTTNTTPIALTGGSPANGTYSGTGVSAGAFTASVAGAGTQVITYTFTDGNGCTNTATGNIVVYVCVGVADAMNSFPLGLYPNPNDGRFTFTLPMDVAGEIAYEVTDARGVIVLRAKSDEPSGTFKQVVNLADFSAGVYTLRVTTNGKVAQKRFVVQR